jgi:hypothetical protein
MDPETYGRHQVREEASVIRVVVVTVMVGVLTMAIAPLAYAEDVVTYEVTSDDIGEVNLEYFDQSVRRALEHVPLPWSTNVRVADPHSNDAEVRADWRPAAWPSRWVTVRILYRGVIVCENTLDVGNAACYGSSSFRN